MNKMLTIYFKFMNQNLINKDLSQYFKYKLQFQHHLKHLG